MTDAEANVIVAAARGLPFHGKIKAYSLAVAQSFMSPLKGAELERAAKFLACLPERQQFWHGGKAGLGVGDNLLPPKKTGKGGARAYERNRVFITTSLPLARAHAMKHGYSSAVYSVKLVGQLEVDPANFRVGLLVERDGGDIASVVTAFMCKRAKVLDVLKLAG